MDQFSSPYTVNLMKRALHLVGIVLFLFLLNGIAGPLITNKNRDTTAVISIPEPGRIEQSLQGLTRGSRWRVENVCAWDPYLNNGEGDWIDFII